MTTTTAGCDRRLSSYLRHTTLEARSFETGPMGADSLLTPPLTLQCLCHEVC
jgi:hypothetical protein